MRLIATADLHGQLPEIEACDLLIVAGDVCPDGPTGQQFSWLDHEFRNWLSAVPAKRVVGIAGNHDFVFERNPLAVSELHLPWVYLQDSGMDYEGLQLWGLPWVPNLPAWAFYAQPSELEARYAMIPSGIDVIISHGPPKGYLDDIGDGVYGHVGAEQGNDAIDRVKPQVFVCGHIHEGYGHRRRQLTHGYVDIYNVAHDDSRYRPVNPPVEIVL